MSSFTGDIGICHKAISGQTARSALVHLRKIPDSSWANEGGRSKGRSRLEYGGADEGSCVRKIPPGLIALGKEAIESARVKIPNAAWENFEIGALVVNKYPKRKGLAKHKDSSKWKPLVLCVTICEDVFGPVSSMRFDGTLNNHERVNLPTPHRSAYVFHDRAYHEATHARNLGSVQQTGMIYSLTFRSE
jgi:hypothetical protein